MKSVQNETRNKIENVIKGLENKVSSDELEIALNQHIEETYASKIKNEVEQHLNVMDSQILKVNTKIETKPQIIAFIEVNRKNMDIKYEVHELSITGYIMHHNIQNKGERGVVIYVSSDLESIFVDSASHRPEFVFRGIILL